MTLLAIFLAGWVCFVIGFLSGALWAGRPE